MISGDKSRISIELSDGFEQEKKCKGIFFRYRENAYFSSHFSIEERRSYRFLKKMSCQGCPLCHQIKEDLSMVGDVWDVFVELDNPVDGNIYEAVFVSSAPDFETGIVDDWRWELRDITDDVKTNSS